MHITAWARLSELQLRCTTCAFWCSLWTHRWGTSYVPFWLKQAPSQIRAAEVSNSCVVSHKWKEAMKSSFPMTFHAFKTCWCHTKQTIDIAKSSRYHEKYYIWYQVGNVKNTSWSLQYWTITKQRENSICFLVQYGNQRFCGSILYVVSSFFWSSFTVFGEGLKHLPSQSWCLCI